jgi:hypothetical protein
VHYASRKDLAGRGVEVWWRRNEGVTAGEDLASGWGVVGGESGGVRRSSMCEVADTTPLDLKGRWVEVWGGD